MISRAKAESGYNENNRNAYKEDMGHCESTFTVGIANEWVLRLFI